MEAIAKAKRLPGEHVSKVDTFLSGDPIFNPQYYSNPGPDSPLHLPRRVLLHDSLPKWTKMSHITTYELYSGNSGERKMCERCGETFGFGNKIDFALGSKYRYSKYTWKLCTRTTPVRCFFYHCCPLVTLFVGDGKVAVEEIVYGYVLQAALGWFRPPAWIPQLITKCLDSDLSGKYVREGDGTITHRKPRKNPHPKKLHA